jgi:hypothetical protein
VRVDRIGLGEPTDRLCKRADLAWIDVGARWRNVATSAARPPSVVAKVVVPAVPATAITTASLATSSPIQHSGAMASSAIGIDNSTL